MTHKRGDIVVVVFPDSNLKRSKPRPALVVQVDNLNSGLPQLVLAMITSNMARAGHPSRVTVALATPVGQQSGLRLDSVIMADNLQTVLESRIHQAIGTWADMTAVDTALRHTLGL
jgi:mRNA interferase MazF